MARNLYSFQFSIEDVHIWHSNWLSYVDYNGYSDHQYNIRVKGQGQLLSLKLVLHKLIFHFLMEVFIFRTMIACGVLITMMV